MGADNHLTVNMSDNTVSIDEAISALKEAGWLGPVKATTEGTDVLAHVPLDDEDFDIPDCLKVVKVKREGPDVFLWFRRV